MLDKITCLILVSSFSLLYCWFLSQHARWPWLLKKIPLCSHRRDVTLRHFNKYLKSKTLMSFPPSYFAYRTFFLQSVWRMLTYREQHIAPSWAQWQEASSAHSKYLPFYGTPGIYLEILDKILKRVFNVIDPGQAFRPHSPSYRRDVVSLFFFLHIFSWHLFR